MNVGGVNKVAIKAAIVFLLVLFVIIVPVILTTSTGLTSRLQADTEQEPSTTLAVPETQTQESSTVKRSSSIAETTSIPLDDTTGGKSPDKETATEQSSSTQKNDSTPSTPSQTSPSQTTTATTTQSSIKPASFSNSFSPSGYAGWSIQTSGTQEEVKRSADYFECTIGGYDSLYHYARLRRSLPNQDKLALTKSISAEIDFEIPADFYDKQESFIRILSFDNYADLINGTDEKLGSDEANEWRLGLVLYNSDKLLRLDSEHKRNETLSLWQLPTQLEPGRHQIKFDVSLAQGTTGSWSVSLDGKNVGSASNVQTIPSTLVKPQEREITQITACLDGAGSQDTTPISLQIRSLAASGS